MSTTRVAHNDTGSKPLSPIDFAKAEVTDLTILYTLMHAARSEKFFQVARAHLKLDHFSRPGENAFKAIWAMVLEHHDKYGQLPTYAALRMRALNTVEFLPGAIAIEFDATESGIAWMFDKTQNPDDDLNIEAATETLKEILLDRAIGDRIKQAVARYGDRGVYGLPKILEESKAEIDEINLIGGTPEKAELWLHTPEEFEATLMPEEWLVDDLFVSGQSIVIYGDEKTLKTTLSLELAVCLGLGPGAKFLHKFEIGKQHRVGFFSAESHGRTLMARYDAILASRDRKREHCQIFFSGKVPRLDDPKSMAEFETVLKERKIDVVVIDPFNKAIGKGAETLSNAALTQQYL